MNGDNEKQSLEAFLHERYTANTVRRYLMEINAFLRETGREKAVHANYGDMMSYVALLREKYDCPETIKCSLHAIRKYYKWLVHTGVRTDNPCMSIKLRDKSSRDIQLQDLFSPAELEGLLNLKRRGNASGVRNKIVTGLLIYQGLTMGEIPNISLDDINLEEGTIYIRPTGRTNGRTLKLKQNQVMLFYKYIHGVRPEHDRGQNDRFLLSKLGEPISITGLTRFAGSFKQFFPGRDINARIIRQSVIANLLKQGHDVRFVQVFAGHKYPGTTENYRQTGIEELKAGIDKYHPLR
ncbi:tyrosine-type recombinase/integrase [Candidatus Micrarchaeota archaeon]|nr:tyrosine-type recombinase/integrase [Candidatus Micrarchaeota archaeon]